MTTNHDDSEVEAIIMRTHNVLDSFDTSFDTTVFQATGFGNRVHLKTDSDHNFSEEECQAVIEVIHRAMKDVEMVTWSVPDSVSETIHEMRVFAEEGIDASPENLTSWANQITEGLYCRKENQ